jgi:hypothetical protein
MLHLGTTSNFGLLQLGSSLHFGNSLRTTTRLALSRATPVLAHTLRSLLEFSPLGGLPLTPFPLPAPMPLDFLAIWHLERLALSPSAPSALHAPPFAPRASDPLVLRLHGARLRHALIAPLDFSALQKPTRDRRGDSPAITLVILPQPTRF